MNASKFQELLAKARAISETAKEKQAADDLAKNITDNKITEVDLSNVGLKDAVLSTDAGSDAAVDFIRDVVSNISNTGDGNGAGSSDSNTSSAFKGPGVARSVTLNEKQQQFYDTVLKGEDSVLIGAAGTGKTTATGRTTKGLIESKRIGNIQSSTKWLRAGFPGITILSYTRKAVNNIRYAVDEQLKSHTLTIHKLLEFAPIYYEVEDPATGEFKKTMKFEPGRNFMNPLPTDLLLLVFEESSMISVDLYHMLQEAMPHKHQEVFLGDIQQLPPVFGMAILGFKMLELPVVELTEVYRQALESPIIDLAWKVLKGDRSVFDPKYEKYTTDSKHTGKPVTRIRVPALDKLSKTTDKGTVQFQVWQKKQSADLGCDAFIKQVTVWIDQGYFNADKDIILCPFNKAFGTIEINKGISQFLGLKRQALVHEIIAGYNRHYLAVGDRVLYDKEDAVIVDIARNSEYTGEFPQPASINLDRWGHQQSELSKEEVNKILTDDASFDADKFLDSVVSDIDDRVNKASHVVVIKLAMAGEDDKPIILEDAKQINDLLGGYALTVHKAQGSENERVFLVFHWSHSVMLQRELLYTGITRAKNFLHIVCEYDTFWNGVYSQRIKGNTIAQKAEFFMGKKGDYDKLVAEVELKKKQSAEFTSSNNPDMNPDKEEF